MTKHKILMTLGNKTPDVDTSALNDFISNANNATKTLTEKSNDSEQPTKRGRPPRKLGEKAIKRTYSVERQDVNDIEEIILRSAKGGKVCSNSEVIRAGIAMLMKIEDYEEMASITSNVKSLK